MIIFNNLMIHFPKMILLQKILFYLNNRKIFVYNPNTKDKIKKKSNRKSMNKSLNYSLQYFPKKKITIKY